MKLASRFANRSPSLRSSSPLTDDQIRAVAPSIFAVDKHTSRSDRYTYIPTGEVLTALRKEGFEPFMVCQTRVRQDDRRDFTKHMVRMRHATQVNDAEANEIVLLNSHDGIRVVVRLVVPHRQKRFFHQYPSCKSPSCGDVGRGMHAGVRPLLAKCV